MSGITPDEIMVACMARQVKNGEMVAQGIATPLVAAAYLLARYTHAPDLYFCSAIGQGICRHPAPLSIINIERLWLDQSLCNIGFVRAAADILPSMRPKEFFRPAQIDPFGNFNNIAFGKNYIDQSPRSPKLRLPGTGGIPDVTIYIDHIYLYVPRHSRLTFVEKLDVCSGMGYSPYRSHGAGPKYLVTDLCQFDFENFRIRLLSMHPGVTINQIQAHTGFDFEMPVKIPETPLPSNNELNLLRNFIDPFDIRKLELLSGNKRRQHLHSIIEKELQSI